MQFTVITLRNGTTVGNAEFKMQKGLVGEKVNLSIGDWANIDPKRNLLIMKKAI